MHVLSLQPVCDRLALETNYIKFVNNIFHVFSLAISSKHCWGVFYHYLSETGYIVHSSACSTLTVLRHSEAGLILGSELFASFCLNASSHIIDDPFRSWPQWLSFLFAAPHRPNAHRCFFYFYLSFFFFFLFQKIKTRVSLYTPIWSGTHHNETGLGPKVSPLLLFSRVWSLEAGVIAKCEPPDLCAGKQTRTLRKSIWDITPAQ